MAFETATLAVASFVHLAGDTPGGSKPPFQASGAGVAEAIIGMALLYGAILVWRAATQARTAAIVTTSFAILGFLVGLNFTAQGGDVADLVYHATMLPVLIVTLIILVRAGKDPNTPTPAPPGG